MREYLNKIISLEQEQPVEEGAVKDMIQDVEEGMGKEEFEKKYPGQNYDEIRQEIEDRMNEETVEEDDIEIDPDITEQNSPERQKQIQQLYRSAGDAWADGNRLSNNFTIHKQRWRMRNDPQVKQQIQKEDEQGWNDKRRLAMYNPDMEEDCGCEDDAMVSVPVQELADILQLAGYENYADKIEEYANEPEEEYSDIEDQLIGLSGGLNRPKKQYPASAPGDNPMDQEPREIEESVADKLYKSYKAFLESEKISEEPMKKQIGPGTPPNKTPSSAPVQQSTEPEKPNIDKEFQDVVNSRNEIKINRFLAKQNPEDAKRLGSKYYGKGYSPNINPEK